MAQQRKRRSYAAGTFLDRWNGEYGSEIVGKVILLFALILPWECEVEVNEELFRYLKSITKFKVRENNNI